jgi:hypothetical protein
MGAETQTLVSLSPMARLYPVAEAMTEQPEAVVGYDVHGQPVSMRLDSLLRPASGPGGRRPVMLRAVAVGDGYVVLTAEAASAMDEVWLHDKATQSESGHVAMTPRLSISQVQSNNDDDDRAESEPWKPDEDDEANDARSAEDADQVDEETSSQQSCPLAQSPPFGNQGGSVPGSPKAGSPKAGSPKNSALGSKAPSSKMEPTPTPQHNAFRDRLGSNASSRMPTKRRSVTTIAAPPAQSAAVPPPPTAAQKKILAEALLQKLDKVHKQSAVAAASVVPTSDADSLNISGNLPPESAAGESVGAPTPLETTSVGTQWSWEPQQEAIACQTEPVARHETRGDAALHSNGYNREGHGHARHTEAARRGAPS